jgi:hypothetical protein
MSVTENTGAPQFGDEPEFLAIGEYSRIHNYPANEHIGFARRHQFGVIEIFDVGGKPLGVFASKDPDIIDDDDRVIGDALTALDKHWGKRANGGSPHATTFNGTPIETGIKEAFGRPEEPEKAPPLPHNEPGANMAAALTYAAKRGWYVFPAPPGKKSSYRSKKHPESKGANWGQDP